MEETGGTELSRELPREVKNSQLPSTNRPQVRTRKREIIKERLDQSIKEFLSDPYAMATLEPGEAGPNGAEGGRFSVSPVCNERPGSGAMGRLDFHS